MEQPKYYLVTRQEGTSLYYSLRNPLGEVLAQSLELCLLAIGCINRGIRIASIGELGTIKKEIKGKNYRDRSVKNPASFQEFWKSYNEYKSWLDFRRGGEPISETNTQFLIKRVDPNEKPLR